MLLSDLQLNMAVDFAQHFNLTMNGSAQMFFNYSYDHLEFKNPFDSAVNRSILIASFTILCAACLTGTLNYYKFRMITTIVWTVDSRQGLTF